MRAMSKVLLKSDIARARYKQVLKAVDALAAKDQIAFLTTKRVSLVSGISDGVLFRLFPSKEHMLEAWLESRGEQVRELLKGTPAGHRSLHHLVQKLLHDAPLLSFLCCQAMDTPYLRQQLEYYRMQFRRFVHTRIELMYARGWLLPADALTDHLIQSVYRS